MTTAAERARAAEAATPMTQWLPYQHINRACDLTESVDQLDLTGGEHIPNRIALASLHVAIAQAKMIGRQRA